jgi:predicted ribosomally synthesized peptide with SipW-like signal peptide
MKKKILSIALVACLALVAIAGASLAYFTDTDNATNSFTSGKVDIKLNEVFDEENAQLIPGVDIQKDVTISLSDDSVESYVWYTYAIPAALDNADNQASNNIIHVNHAGRNWLGYQNNQKYWADGQTSATPEDQCWIIDNVVIEQKEIDGVLYNVYVVLYNGTLEAGEETTIGMTKVYCDTKVDFDNETGKYTINGQDIGFDLNNVKIIVTAYGIQAATFDTVQEAYAAYNAQLADLPAGSVDID